MRALEFITDHVIYNPAYTYRLQLKIKHPESNKRHFLLDRNEKILGRLESRLLKHSIKEEGVMAHTKYKLH